MVGQPIRPAQLDELARHMIENMDMAIPQHLANTSWAVARLGHSPLNGRFLDAVIKKVCRQQPLQLAPIPPFFPSLFAAVMMGKTMQRMRISKST